jgi:hypothetical protein
VTYKPRNATKIMKPTMIAAMSLNPRDGIADLKIVGLQRGLGDIFGLFMGPPLDKTKRVSRVCTGSCSGAVNRVVSTGRRNTLS